MPEDKPVLSEKDFIQEPQKRNPYPFWLWITLLCVLTALFLGGNIWYGQWMRSVFVDSPFLQVTNRQLSLFLWENPEFMRVNSPSKAGYLPAFKYTDKLTIDIAEADHYVAAPPELLFRYHTWDRLVKKEFSQRPISVEEFIQFLGYAEEWHPNYWTGAPAGYRELVDGLSTNQSSNLAPLPLTTLPLDIRIAFQGWRNYFKDGEAINKLQPTWKQMRQFLEKHPHYARNYWRNLVLANIPNYLKDVNQKGNDASIVPSDQLSAFLRVAVYNYLMTQKDAEMETEKTDKEKTDWTNEESNLSEKKEERKRTE